MVLLPKFIFSLRIHVYNHVFSSPDVTNETLSGAWHPEHLALHCICISIKRFLVFISMESLHKLSEAIFDLKDKLTDSEFKNLYDISKKIHDDKTRAEHIPVYIYPAPRSGRFQHSPIYNTQFRRQMENSGQRARTIQEIQNSLLRQRTRDAYPQPSFFERLFTWNWK
jgi:hypothetical protein